MNFSISFRQMVNAFAVTVVLSSPIAFANTAYADASANAGAVAAAQATLNAGDSLALGNSVGAAMCVDAVGTPIISFAISRKSCEIMQGAMSMYDRGLLSSAEARAFGLAALERAGARLVDQSQTAPASTTTLSTSGTAAVPETLRVRLDNGRSYTLRTQPAILAALAGNPVRVGEHMVVSVIN